MKEITLTKGYVAQVDDTDFDELNKYKWFVVVGKTNVYARRKLNDGAGVRRELLMHRSILQPPDSNTHVDHIDGNGLNNQRCNIRLCTPAENTRNSRSIAGSSSAFKGVSWNKARKKWKATISLNGGLKHLGLFENENIAAAAYNYAAKIIFGKFARLNDVCPLFLPVNLDNIILRDSNTSGFRGVSFHKKAQKWVAQIENRGGNNYIGLFSTPEEAAVAYDNKAKDVFGDKAVLNFKDVEQAIDITEKYLNQ